MNVVDDCRAHERMSLLGNRGVLCKELGARRNECYPILRACADLQPVLCILWHCCCKASSSHLCETLYVILAMLPQG